jgi:hypothetical protein
MIRLAIALSTMISACAASATPVATPGQVANLQDATFRMRDGGAIDVSVRRAFRGHEAAGAATLHGMTLEAAQHSVLVGVATARAWLEIEAALAADPLAAYEAAQHGIDELGTEYRGVGGSHHVIDDTGNAIRHARMAAESGDHAGAAEELTEVLRERVAIYLRAFKGAVE